MPQNILFALELIGTVAFALSGATVGISKKMDIFGVITLGVVTSVGGGVIRDVILGNTPPATFRNPVYALLAIFISATIFVPAVRRFLFKKQKIYESFLLIADSVGLGIFTVVGIETAVLSGNSNFFLLLFVGLVTGTGGGVMRDILAGNTPYIFIKHFYATASLIGGAVCILLWDFYPHAAAIYCGAVCVTVLRFLAARFRWSLPKAEDHFE